MRKQLLGGGPALFRLVRFWSRRWASASTLEEVAHVQVLEAVDAASPCSVSSIATELGVDLSNASRMVKAAVELGYLTRRPASDDARRTELAPTAKGRRLLAQARRWQEATFERLTADWPKADATRFAAYLGRLASEASE